MKIQIYNIILQHKLNYQTASMNKKEIERGVMTVTKRDNKLKKLKSNLRYF